MGTSKRVTGWPWTGLASWVLLGALISLVDPVGGFLRPLGLVAAAVNVGIAVALLGMRGWAITLTALRGLVGLVLGYMDFEEARIRMGGWEQMPPVLQAWVWIVFTYLGSLTVVAFVVWVWAQGKATGERDDEE